MIRAFFYLDLAIMTLLAALSAWTGAWDLACFFALPFVVWAGLYTPQGQRVTQGPYLSAGGA